MKHPWFYIGMFFSLIFLVILSLGGGIWVESVTLTHWTGEMFRGVCHQNPERSFYVKGAYMAVNTRCFGIFAGLLAGWILIPVFVFRNIKNNWSLWVLLFAVIVQIIDYSGNLFQVWENTNISRFYLGMFLGIVTSLSISDQFKPKKNKSNYE